MTLASYATRTAVLTACLLAACGPGEPDGKADGDGDGYAAGDCDDDNAALNPMATDIAGDNIDQNCDGVDGTDHDADGVASEATAGTDCDDADAGVYPGAAEHCDDRDEDCDGIVDEDAVDPSLWYPDGDYDGQGAGEPSVEGCAPPSGASASGEDCDDNDPRVYLGAPELCDLEDNDCDDTIDEVDESTGESPCTTVRQIRDGTGSGYVSYAVVTTPLTEDGQGFFIQDPGGGPRSGVYVYAQFGFDPSDVALGDMVVISGTVMEFYDFTELVVTGADAITIIGTMSVPDPVDLGDGSGVDWDDYESVLVTLDGQTVESVDEYGYGLLSCGLTFRDWFVSTSFEAGGSYAAMTGVVLYTYETWSFGNRSSDDLVGYTAP